MQLNTEKLAIYLGGIMGAFWQSNFKQIINDLLTISHLEGAIIISCKAIIGVIIGWLFRKSCRYITRMYINFKQKKQKK